MMWEGWESSDVPRRREGSEGVESRTLVFFAALAPSREPAPYYLLEDSIMHEIVNHRRELVAFSGPREAGVRVREAVPGDDADLAFIDRLQKMHSKMVGWMPTGQLEGHIAKGHVLIAERAESNRGCTQMDTESMGEDVTRRRGDAEKRGDMGIDAIVQPSGADGQVDAAGGLGLEPQTPSAPPRLCERSSFSSSAVVERVGYCIGVDRYFKREDVGIIYQMNVLPGVQRGLIGATLLQSMFDRWPRGVRLCCCWCAQDLTANYFWEAMGFVPLAFRAGSERKSRIHIFWQKQIRLESSRGWTQPPGMVTDDSVTEEECSRRRRDAEEGRGFVSRPIQPFAPSRLCESASPAGSVRPVVDGSEFRGNDFRGRGDDFRGRDFRGWWFPSQTGSGSLREDRLVLPIPPGTRWQDAKPIVLPGAPACATATGSVGESNRGWTQMNTDGDVVAGGQRLRRKKKAEAATEPSREELARRAMSIRSGGLRFGPPPEVPAASEASPAEGKAAKAKKKPARTPRKNDPRLVALARELRDRWVEAVESGRLRPELACEGAKYLVGKVVEDDGGDEVLRLPAA
jgi:hypothetical protein